MQQVSAMLERTADRETTEELLLRMNDAGLSLFRPGIRESCLPSTSQLGQNTHRRAETHTHTHDVSLFISPQMRVFAHATVLSGQDWLVSSHRLVLLPRPLEVHAAVLSALDDRPATTSTLHVAEHLHVRHSKSATAGGTAL